MFVLHRARNGWHLKTDLCRRGKERKRRQLAEEEARGGGAETVITAYGIPLNPSSSLKYLERVVLELDDDWPTVVHNLSRERQKWARMIRVVGR